MKEKFRKVSERTMHRGRFLSIDVDTYEAADGSRFDREIVRHPGAVTVVAIDERDRDAGPVLVLVRQFRPAIEMDQDELPAGVLDVEGESPESAAARELAEEAGLAAGSMEFVLRFAAAPGFSNEWISVYLARDLRDVPTDRQGPEEEHMTVVRVPFAEAVERAFSGGFTDAKTVVGVLAVAARFRLT